MCKKVTYGLYLSTTGVTNKPYNKTNLNNVKWNINWKEIFGSATGECNVRVKVVSASASNLTFANNIGSVRASFASNYQNSTNGFNLGCVLPVLDNTSATANTTYLECDTIATTGVTMIIPTTNNDFTISFLNSSEGVMANVPEYQIWLYFDKDNNN
jgi:hypothetical protein